MYILTSLNCLNNTRKTNVNICLRKNGLHTLKSFGHNITRITCLRQQCDLVINTLAKVLKGLREF